MLINCSSIMACCSTAQRLRKTSENHLGKVKINLKRTEATIFTNDQARLSSTQQVRSSRSCSSANPMPRRRTSCYVCLSMSLKPRSFNPHGRTHKTLYTTSYSEHKNAHFISTLISPFGQCHPLGVHKLEGTFPWGGTCSCYGHVDHPPPPPPPCANKHPIP